MRRERYESEQRRRREAQARQVYDFVCDFTEDTGFSPSMKEIAEACYLSRSSVVRYLDLLEAWDYVWREPGRPRSIGIIDPDRRL
jgi:repressor LexA